MGKMSELHAMSTRIDDDDQYQESLYTLTITALSPKSYDSDLALLKRVHKKFRESFPGIGLSTSSLKGYEVQTKRRAHSLHMHSFFSAMALPVFEDNLKIHLKKVKCQIDISPVEDIQGWINYCMKDQAVDHRWAYKQYHEDLFQEG